MAAHCPIASPLIGPLPRPLWIPATGLALVLFLVAHLGGLALALVDPVAFEQLAVWLHSQVWLAPLELALAAALLAHPLLALAKLIGASGRRPGAAGPLVSRRGQGAEAVAAWSARLLPASGGLLLLFLAVHLVQLRWVRPAAGQELASLLAVLASPWSLLLYVSAGLALALHLFHGHESAHRSLGLLDRSNGGRIRTSGRGLALLLGAGFALLPVLLLVGPGLVGAGQFGAGR